MCIQYFIIFKGYLTQVGKISGCILAFFDLSNEVNVMNLVIAEKLGLAIWSTNIGAQKINGTIFEIYGIVIVVFSVTDQVNKVKFFQEIFLVANINPNVVLGMLFLTLTNTDIDFPERELW